MAEPLKGNPAKLSFAVEAWRVDAHGSRASCKDGELAHDNVRKFGTVFNTVAPGTALTGILRRKVVEAFYGWRADSLALLADAGHNLSNQRSIG